MSTGMAAQQRAFASFARPDLQILKAHPPNSQHPSSIFFESAREQSDSAADVQSGGDLGKVAPGHLAAEVEAGCTSQGKVLSVWSFSEQDAKMQRLPPQEVAFSLALGEISEPFESPEGVHMLMRIA